MRTPREPGQPLVSIIIPCRDAGPMIEQCLKSCLLQTYPHIEIIVVDNNSTDESIAIARRFKPSDVRPITIVTCVEPGAGHARNLGYREARGDYIQWLDADDELEPDKIRRQVQALETQPEFGIAYGSWKYCVYKNGELTQTFTLTALPYDDYLFELLINNWRPPHSYLMRRSVADRLNESGGWNTKDQMADDRQYFSLAALLGVRFLAVPSARVAYNQWSPKQLTASTTIMDFCRDQARMFENLKTRLNERPGVTLSEDQNFLMNMDRGVWSIRLGKEAGQETLTETPLERTVLAALRDPNTYAAVHQGATPPVLPIEFFAILVIRSLWRKAVGVSAGAAGAWDAAKTLRQMDSFLEVAPKALLPRSSLKDDLILDCPVALPVLCDYRLPVLRTLAQLCEKGYLKKPAPLDKFTVSEAGHPDPAS